MPNQPTPTPLTWDEVDDALTAEYAYTDKTIQRLWAELLASRAESAALRAAVAEAEKYGAPVAGAKALGFVKDPCKKHDAYWTTASGACMACRAVEAEQSRDALAAELAEARKVVVRMAQMVRWLDCKVADRITITPEQEATINEAYEIVYKAALAARDAGKALAPAAGDDHE